MSAAVPVAAQLAGLALAPLLPGLVQATKARLQGRRGAGVLQPYRELRRLWHRSVVAPEGAGAVYRSAPAVVAAALAVAILMVPAGESGVRWPAGHDVLLLIGLLTLARFATALAAWDTGGGFGLMGAARDLTFAVFGEILLGLTLLIAVLEAGTTDLRGMWLAAAGTDVWSQPAHWCGLLGIALVVMFETGRQPFDNPDTHLELTMVHEGPLLEYSGRDLAYLTWAMAARHWVVMVLAAGLFLPHPAGAAGVAAVAGWVLVMSLLMAATETWLAKMRLLRVPGVLLAGAAVALVGIVSWAAGVGA